MYYKRTSNRRYTCTRDVITNCTLVLVIDWVYYKCTVYYEFSICTRDVITNCNMSLVLLWNECTTSVQNITGWYFYKRCYY